MPTPTPTPVVRLITSQPQTQSQTVHVTGTAPATQATGTIIITNMRYTSLHLDAETQLSNGAGCATTGLQIRLDSAVDLAANSGQGWPRATVSIHVTQPGTAGNVQDCSGNTAFIYCFPDRFTGGPEGVQWNAYDINGFTGGTDAQPNTIVQQSDIDTAANSLEATTKQSAIADIKRQLRDKHLHLISDPQCSFHVTKNHVAGAHTSTVTVNVQTTCKAKAST